MTLMIAIDLNTSISLTLLIQAAKGPLSYRWIIHQEILVSQLSSNMC